VAVAVVLVLLVLVADMALPANSSSNKSSGLIVLLIPCLRAFRQARDHGRVMRRK